MILFVVGFIVSIVALTRSVSNPEKQESNTKLVATGAAISALAILLSMISKD